MPLKGSAARLFLEGNDLSCITTELTVEATTGEYEAITLCSEMGEYVPGINNGTIGLNGYFKGANIATGEETHLYAALGATTKSVAAIFDYTTLPAPAYTLQNASNVNLTYTAPMDGLIAMNGSFKGKEGMKRGLLTHYKVTKTTATQGTAVQIPGTLVSSTGKAFVFIQGIGGTRTTPITVTLESSANGTTGWAVEANYSFTGLGASCQSFTAPAGAYFTYNVTDLGGATSVVVSMIVIVDAVTT
jgi:hypothetical protein